MPDLPRRVLRMELPIVEHLVRTNKQTNKQNQEKQKVNKAKQTKQSLHHQTTSYFCELTVKTDHQD